MRFRTLAPAKVNVRLRVTGRRVDGYHLLDMINVGVSLYDTIAIEFNSAAEISLSITGVEKSFQQELEDPLRNIAAKAFREYWNHRGVAQGCSLFIEKRIPHQAGLGGGSSDAAAVLRLCEHYARRCGMTPLDPHVYSALAKSLGADVPYLLDPVPARVTGIGECIELLPRSQFQNEMLLVVPPAGNPTPLVFSELRNDPLFQFSPVKLESQANHAITVENDLFPYAQKVNPSLASTVSALSVFKNITVGLSGSGSALFVFGKGRSGADEIESAHLLTQKSGCMTHFVTILSSVPHVIEG